MPDSLDAEACSKKGGFPKRLKKRIAGRILTDLMLHQSISQIALSLDPKSIKVIHI